MSNPQQQLTRLLPRHPLQRLSSPSPSLSLAIHVLGLSSFTYSYTWLITHPNEINSAYGWHFQYLTIIGLTLATFTFILGTLADLCSIFAEAETTVREQGKERRRDITLSLSHRLFAAKNVLSICSAPLALLISTLYWGLRAIDPELVVPKHLQLPLPPDLSFHFSPAFFLLLDLLFFSPPWTISVVPALGLSTAIALAYWFWIEVCFAKNGFYPYPLFAVLSGGQRMGLFGGSAVVMAVETVGIKWVYGRVNGNERPGRVKG